LIGRGKLLVAWLSYVGYSSVNSATAIYRKLVWYFVSLALPTLTFLYRGGPGKESVWKLLHQRLVPNK